MDYSQFVKRFNIPESPPVPTLLRYEDIEARAITREDLQEDVKGINASIDLIRRTRGGRWPTEEVTEEGNYVDLVWHECEFRDADSFTYAVYDSNGEYLGCCYLYPMGRRTKLTSEELLRYDVDVSWWVTPPAYEQGYYTKLYRALRHWLAELPFEQPYYSNHEMPADG